MGTTLVNEKGEPYAIATTERDITGVRRETWAVLQEADDDKKSSF
jgi:hypothetical protein